MKEFRLMSRLVVELMANFVEICAYLKFIHRTNLH